MTLGNLLGGRAADRNGERALPTGLVGLALAMLAFAALSGSAMGLFAAAFAVGFAAMYVGPAVQARLIAASGDAPLKPGQSVQGTIQADVGNGSQSFRSLSTKVADDIGEQVDEKLGSGEGQAAIDDANRKLDTLGTGTQVSASDVRDIVGGMAGKTFHDASVRRIDIIHTLQVNLAGKSGDSQLQLDLGFDDKTLALADAQLTYRPKASAMFDVYESKDVQVVIERFVRNEDGSYAIAGSFTAKDVPASKMAKRLDAATLPSASGRFDYAALPLKEMPKFGK